jgi:ABC-2 type transport system ATP-binding protein
MAKLGKKQLVIELHNALESVPAALKRYQLELAGKGRRLIYTYDTQSDRTGITSLLRDLSESGIRFRDIDTTQSSLEDIFVDLVKK